MRREISGYAMKNYRETLAEAMASVNRYGAEVPPLAIMIATLYTPQWKEQIGKEREEFDWDA